MNKDNDYFRIFLDSIDKMGKKALAASIPQIDLEPGKPFPLDLFSLLDQVGILGLSNPGSGFSDPASIVRVLTRLSEYCAGIAGLSAYSLAADQFLRLAGMDVEAGPVSLCLYEDEELDLTSDSMKFRTVLRDGLLTGKKRSVVLGGFGGPYAVFAQGDGGALLCLVEHDGETVAVEELGLLGTRVLKVADVAFSGAAPVRSVPVSREQVVHLFSILSLFTGACLCGTASRAVEIAREYARERYQGGNMIESHDAIRLLLEQSRSALLAARGCILDTAASFDPTDVRSMAGCLQAKASASAAAVNATLDAIQVHGGYGYMRDYGVEKRFRDAATLSVLPLDSTRLLLLANSLAD